MKKIDLGQRISILANLGVIAGIVFLGIEVRQNNDALNSQSRGAWVDRRVEVTHMLALNPELLGVVMKATKGEEPLTELEQERVRLIGKRTLVVFALQFDEMQLGRLLEDEVRGLQSNVYHSRGNNFGVPRVWEQYKVQEANPEYVIWFEENVVKEQ